MEFRLLGPLEVEADGALLPIGSRQPRAVLTILLLDPNRVVSHDRLMDALWGDEAPEHAVNALQVYVSQLRKGLGPDRIVTQQLGYLLRLSEQELDLDRFESLVAGARRSEPDVAAQALRQALALWRGDPLGDLPDTPFAESERRRLAELRLAALEERIDADLELDRHAGLVAELESLVREHPLRERLRGQLMLALYRCGRQAEALGVYREGRRLLDEELGLQPGEELRRLERAILEQDPSLVLVPRAERGRTAAVPTGTVTFLLTGIEGSATLARDLGGDYARLLEQHHALLSAAFVKHGGLEIESRDDALLFAFRRARDCVRAAVEGLKASTAAAWPGNAAVRLRVGIHTGEPGFAESGYQGLDVAHAAGLSGAAHGGQILISSATRDLVETAVEGVSFEDLGEHRLRELERPERVFQVVAPGLAADFPPPRADAATATVIRGREEELAVAAGAVVGVEERRVRVLRRSVVVAALGALLLAGAIAGLVFALTGGSATVHVAPDSVAVVDAGSGRLEADVPAGKRPVAVAVGEGGVWVANAGDQTVVRIDPKKRKLVSTIGIGTDVAGIAAGYGSVWIADGNDGTVTQIDPKQNAVRATIHLGAQDELQPSPVFSVAAGAGSVWVTRGRRLVRIDPQTGEPTGAFRIPQPVSIAAADDAVWVATKDERLLRLDARTVRPTGDLSLPGIPVSIAARPGAVWMIVAPGRGPSQIWRVDPESVIPTWTTTSARFPIDVALGRDAVWVAELSGTVRRIDTRSEAQRTVRLGLAPTAAAVDANSVWVAVQRPS